MRIISALENRSLRKKFLHVYIFGEDICKFFWWIWLIQTAQESGSHCLVMQVIFHWALCWNHCGGPSGIITSSMDTSHDIGLRWWYSSNCSCKTSHMIPAIIERWARFTEKLKNAKKEESLSRRRKQRGQADKGRWIHRNGQEWLHCELR